MHIFPLEYKKELIHSAWVHAIFLAGFFIFSFVSTRSSFHHQKYVTVNLSRLGTGSGLPGGPSTSPEKPKTTTAEKKLASPNQAAIPIKKETPPAVQKKSIPATPAPKVQKLVPVQAPKKVMPPVQTAAPHQKPIPSLTDRLKKRLAEVKSDKKFVEPKNLASPKTSAKPMAQGKFMEYNEWSKIQKSKKGSTTSAVGLGGASGPGSGYGQGGSSGKEFPYAWYIDMIQTEITSNWREPARPPANGQLIHAIVQFDVEKDGRVSRISLVEKSELVSLNDSVVEAVRSSDPLPPLPQGYPGKTLTVRIKFELTQ